MATFYSCSATPPKEDGTWGKVEFSTNSGELYTLVADMVRTAVDAVAYRNRVERIAQTIDCTDYE